MEFKESFAEICCDFISFFSAYASLQSSYLVQHLLSCQISLRTLLSLGVSLPLKAEHEASSKRHGRQHICSSVTSMAIVSQIIMPEALWNFDERSCNVCLERNRWSGFQQHFGKCVLACEIVLFYLHSCRIYCSELCLIGVPGHATLHGINWT